MTEELPNDWGTIKVPREDFEEHNDRRKDMGLTWAEYLDGQAPDPGIDTDELTMSIVAELDADDVDSELDRIAERIDALDDGLPTADGGLDYDDVRAACADAVEGVLGDRS